MGLEEYTDKNRNNPFNKMRKISYILLSLTHFLFSALFGSFDLVPLSLFRSHSFALGPLPHFPALS